MIEVFCGRGDIAQHDLPGGGAPCSAFNARAWDTKVFSFSTAAMAARVQFHARAQEVRDEI